MVTGQTKRIINTSGCVAAVALLTVATLFSCKTMNSNLSDLSVRTADELPVPIPIWRCQTLYKETKTFRATVTVRDVPTGMEAVLIHVQIPTKEPGPEVLQQFPNVDPKTLKQIDINMSLRNRNTFATPKFTGWASPTNSNKVIFEANKGDLTIYAPNKTFPDYKEAIINLRDGNNAVLDGKTRFFCEQPGKAVYQYGETKKEGITFTITLEHSQSARLAQLKATELNIHEEFKLECPADIKPNSADYRCKITILPFTKSYTNISESFQTGKFVEQDNLELNMSDEASSQIYFKMLEKIDQDYVTYWKYHKGFGLDTFPTDPFHIECDRKSEFIWLNTDNHCKLHIRAFKNWTHEERRKMNSGEPTDESGSAPKYLAFVTKGEYPANFGGREQANKICASETYARTGNAPSIAVYSDNKTTATQLFSELAIFMLNYDPNAFSTPADSKCNSLFCAPTIRGGEKLGGGPSKYPSAKELINDIFGGKPTPAVFNLTDGKKMLSSDSQSTFRIWTGELTDTVGGENRNNCMNWTSSDGSLKGGIISAETKAIPQFPGLHAATYKRDTDSCAMRARFLCAVQVKKGDRVLQD